jgi:hypothetical protein
MDSADFVLEPEIGATQTRRARVCEVHQDGTVSVVGRSSELLRCDVLTVGIRGPWLAAGQEVLVWHSGGYGERGIILGKIGTAALPREELVCPSQAVSDDGTGVGAPPDSLTIEAQKCLTLRVGDGSITIRADGKILIKGKDLVSHAQRVNRIKGGSVAIN